MILSVINAINSELFSYTYLYHLYVYDKNAAPLLNLSGLDIRLIRLEKNSEANEYMKEIDMNDTDMIVVAGGNATLNEVIKGLVDRPDSKEFLKRIPVIIL